jgi:hypothetical protein
MKTQPYIDAVIRTLSPEMAAEKLGWTLINVLNRRKELGLRPFVGCRVARSQATMSKKPMTGKASKRKAAKRLAAARA